MGTYVKYHQDHFETKSFKIGEGITEILTILSCHARDCAFCHARDNKNLLQVLSISLHVSLEIKYKITNNSTQMQAIRLIRDQHQPEIQNGHHDHD